MSSTSSTAIPSTFPTAVPAFPPGGPSLPPGLPGGLPTSVPFPTALPPGGPGALPPGPSNLPVPFWFNLTPEEFAALPRDDLGPTVMATVWPLLLAATAFLGLRLYCKLSVRRVLWWDDWILILAWTCLTGSNIVTSETIKYGYGRHTYDISFENLVVKLPLLANIGGTFSILAAVWSKTSFAITLLRISQGWMWVSVWCIIVSMNVAMGLSALFIWIQCTPIEKAWNPLMEGTCFPADSIINYLIFSAAYSAAMDIILALLAWKVVLPLNMRKKEKIGVLVAMSMGLVAAATAIIKIVQIPSMKSGDIYDGVVLVVWSTAESAVTIMAASVPVLRSLLKSKTKYKPPSPSPMGQRMKFNPQSFTMQSQSTVVIESRRRSVDKEKSFWKSESRSARTSLDLQPQEGTILQISEVAIEYSRPNIDEEMGRAY